MSYRTKPISQSRRLPAGARRLQAAPCGRARYRLAPGLPCSGRTAHPSPPRRARPSRTPWRVCTRRTRVPALSEGEPLPRRRSSLLDHLATGPRIADAWLVAARAVIIDANRPAHRGADGEVLVRVSEDAPAASADAAEPYQLRKGVRLRHGIRWAGCIPERICYIGRPSSASRSQPPFNLRIVSLPQADHDTP
jgi:hypothetical protein